MRRILLLMLSLTLVSTQALAGSSDVVEGFKGLLGSGKQKGKVVNLDDYRPKNTETESKEQEGSGDSAGGAGELLSVSNPATVEDFIIRTVGVYRDVRGEPLNLQGPGEGVIYFSADRGGTVGLGPQIVMDTASQFGFGKNTPPPKGTDRLLRVFTVDQQSQSITDIAVYNLGEPEEARGNLEEVLGETGLTSEEAKQVAGEIGYGEINEESRSNGVAGFYDEGLKFETETVLRGTESVLSRPGHVTGPWPVTKPIHITGPSLVLTVNGDEFVNSNIVYNVKPIVKMVDDGRGVGLRPVIYFTAKDWRVVGRNTCADGRGGTVCTDGRGVELGNVTTMSGPSKQIGDGVPLISEDKSGTVGLGQVVAMAYEPESDKAINDLIEQLKKHSGQKPSDSPASPESDEEKSSDPADAGKLLYAAGTNQVQVLRDWKVVGGPNIVMQLDPMFMTAGEEQGKVVIVATENGQEAVSESVFKSALDAIKNSPLEITPEGVLAAGSVVAGAALIWKYGRSMNPIGAFIAGLGIGPVAASDYCSRFKGEEGLKIYLNLDQETQLNEAKMCPELAGQILTISESLN